MMVGSSSHVKFGHLIIDLLYKYAGAGAICVFSFKTASGILKSGHILLNTKENVASN
jgi:hypothetical protein